FRANFLAGGRVVRGYHLVNVALHCACSALVARLAQDALRLETGPACLAAMLFAAHPVHTEAVIRACVGANECVSAFVLVSASVCEYGCSDAGGAPALRWLLAAGALSGCALLAKEQGISVLPLCIALRVQALAVARTPGTLRSRDKHRKQWGRKWPRCHHSTTVRVYEDTLGCRNFLLVSLQLAALLAFRLWMLHGTLPQFSEVDNPASFSSRLSTRLLTYSYLGAFNAWLVLCPRTLSYDWQMGSIPLVSSPLDPRNLATVALGTVLALLLWRAFLLTPRYPDEGKPEVDRNRCIPYARPDRIANPPRNAHCMPGTSILIKPSLVARKLLKATTYCYARPVFLHPHLSLPVSLPLFRPFSAAHISHYTSRKIKWLYSSSPRLSFAVVYVEMRRYSTALHTERRKRHAATHGKRKMFGGHPTTTRSPGSVGSTAGAVKHKRDDAPILREHSGASHVHTQYALGEYIPLCSFALDGVVTAPNPPPVVRGVKERGARRRRRRRRAESALARLALPDLGIAQESERIKRNASHNSTRAQSQYGSPLRANELGLALCRVEEAVRQYQRALELQPNHTVALLNAARSLRSMKLNREAESLYKRALAVQQDPQVMDNLAVFYINAGRADQAREIYEQVHLLFPDHLDSKVHYAQLMMRQRSFRTAEDLLLEAVHRNASHREALHQTALLYNHTNRTAEALDYILRALRLCAVDDRSCARLHAEHGDILKDLDDLSSSAEARTHSSALHCFSYLIAIRLDPELAHAHLNLAVIRHLQGDYTGAFRHYQTAFTLDPKNQLIADNMAKLRRRLSRGPSKKNASAKSSDAAFYIR
ncbi:unnamed protein product, partial [Ixodes hexagonus]